TRGLAASPPAGSTAATEIGDGVAVFSLPTPGAFGSTADSPWTPAKEPLSPTWSQVRVWAGTHADTGDNMDPVAGPLVDTTRNGITAPTTTGHAIMPVLVMLELGYGLDVSPDAKYRVMLTPRVVLMNPYNVTLRKADYSLVYQLSFTSKSNLEFTLRQGSTATDTADLKLSDIIAIDGTPKMAFNITDSFGPGEIKVYSLPASATQDVPISGTASIIDLEPGYSTVRAYLEPGKSAPTWYAPASRPLYTAQLGHLPQDHPRLSLALGKAVPGNMPQPSISLRYLPIASDLYSVKPYPQARLDTDTDPSTIDNTAGTGRQLRTLRFTLRHADMDALNYGGSNLDAIPDGSLAPDTTSGDRFLIDANIRAIVSQRLNGRDNVAHYRITSYKPSEYTDIDYQEAGGATFAYWGGSVDDSAGTTHAILFDVLRQGEQIVSLGRLGQVNWGVDGKHPAYPLGNSFASVFYPADKPDYGYVLNEALWDRFFLSTLPVSLATRPDNLPDSRLRFHDPAGAPALTPLEGMNGYQLAATRLMIDGAFNINSTSTEAWTAFLGSVQAAGYAYQSRAGAHTDPAVRAFPRVQNLHDPDPTASGSPDSMYEWTGYRQLDATQLKALATRIVAAIKARSHPARSLAEFINRDLSQPATDVRNQEGIVQAAISAVVNTDTPVSGSGVGLGNLPGLNTAKTVPDANAPKLFKNADNPDAARGKLRSTGAPGFLMQSDLLSPLAPAMSARSDTFRVRTYGEVRNPVTGDINGRAWCEAVVQRMPEFVGGEAAELKLDDAVLGAASKAFGRKFVIVQFRWLGPDEI
ncbi:MAG TPA: hypothetical protein VIO38_15130, partial [Rariglobus sp.]